MAPASPVTPVLVGDPVAVEVAREWTVGRAAPPTVPDPVAARAARLEARLAVYAQYAAVVAEEAAAVAAGEDERRTDLAAARGAAAEHFAELCAPALADDAGATGPAAFADALNDALFELRQQDAVDEVLARRLRALRGAPAALLPAFSATPAGDRATPHIDVRF